MLQEERQKHILDQLAAHGKVRIGELEVLLKVSADTIRRDLIELEEAGKLVRVHGGAIATNFHTPFQPAEVYARKEKIEVATKAMGLVKEGMTLLAGGGTIMLEFARLIPERLKGTLFTVSPLVALEVTQRSSMDVILLSGRLSRQSYVCTGAPVIDQLSELSVDLCLIGTNGFSLGAGVSERNWDVAQVKKAMIKASARTAVLSIAESMGVEHPYKVSPLRSIDYLLTERSASDRSLRRYTRHCKVL